MPVKIKWISCDECEMWVEFEKSGIKCTFKMASKDDFEFHCRNCCRVRELEIMLAEIQTGMLNGENNEDWLVLDEWSTVGEGEGGSSPDTSDIVQVGVEIVNSFRGLEVEGGAEVQELEDNSKRDEKQLWGREKSSGKVLLVGDSIVRYVDREF